MKIAKHPTGQLIKFDEPTHSYISDGQRYVSATSFLGRFFPKFEAHKIAGFVAKKEGTTREAILAKWEKTRDDACLFGTKMHLYAEMKLLGEKTPKLIHANEKKAKKQIDQYLNEILKEYELVETEQILFCPDLKLAGTVDVVLKHKTKKNKYLVVDWKTNREIAKYSKYKKKAFSPIDCLDDCNYSKYLLQLNLYCSIMKREGYIDKDSEVGLILVHINAFSDEPIIYEVDKTEDLIETLLDTRKVTMSARLESYMNIAKKQWGDWKQNNPKSHVCELYAESAEFISSCVKEDGIEQIIVNSAAYSGGVPAYSYAICQLLEDGIDVKGE